MTLIEIRPHCNGWKVFEARRARACLSREKSGNQLRA